jgi:hypothetical protein
MRSRFLLGRLTWKAWHGDQDRERPSRASQMWWIVSLSNNAACASAINLSLRLVGVDVGSAPGESYDWRGASWMHQHDRFRTQEISHGRCKAGWRWLVSRTVDCELRLDVEAVRVQTQTR